MTTHHLRLKLIRDGRDDLALEALALTVEDWAKKVVDKLADDRGMEVDIPPRFVCVKGDYAYYKYTWSPRFVGDVNMEGL